MTVQCELSGLERQAGERGFTLIEMILVMALIIGLFAVVAGGLRQINKADLREETAKIAALTRATYNMATLSGVPHRVVFNLDDQTYRIEACPGDARLYRTPEDRATVEEKLTELMEELKRGGTDPTRQSVAELVGAESPEAALEAAAALEGLQIGGARCEPSKLPNGDAKGAGNMRQISTKGVVVKRIHVAHLEDPVSEGEVAVNFFPLGTAEKAVIEVVDSADNKMVLLVHRLTGMVEWKRGGYDADDHMRRNATGDQEEER
jgi:prepilin-type N-terminal cleavage/methylation domain-containing protein